jgi:ketosteroid isomerase-like protein
MGGFGLAAAKSIIASAAVMVLVAAPGWADAPEAAENAIRAALEQWRSTFNARDEARLCDLFAPDLIANYQGQPERNYDSLCQLLLASVRDPERTYRYSLDVNEILVFGATIVRLVWTLEIEKSGAPPEIVKEPAIDIFQRQGDGSWKISRYLAYPATP